MIDAKELKVGYYYYAENDRKIEGYDYWRFIGKITKKRQGNWFPYTVVKGKFTHKNGIFNIDSAHFKSIKGISKTIKDLRVYMI